MRTLPRHAGPRPRPRQASQNPHWPGEGSAGRGRGGAHPPWPRDWVEGSGVPARLLPPCGWGLPRRARPQPPGRLSLRAGRPLPQRLPRCTPAPPGPLGVLGRIPATLVRGLLHRAQTAAGAVSGPRLQAGRPTRAAPPESTCQSQQRFRLALPGRVAPRRPPQRAGHDAWSPPRGRPSGGPGLPRSRPGLRGRRGASLRGGAGWVEPWRPRTAAEPGGLQAARKPGDQGRPHFTGL